MQLGAQLATGQVFVSLFVVVPRMRFPLSCLASIFYIAAELLIAKDQHVGSHMQVNPADAGTSRWPRPLSKKRFSNFHRMQGMHQRSCHLAALTLVLCVLKRHGSPPGCIGVSLQWPKKAASFRFWSCSEQCFLCFCSVTIC